MKFRCPLAVLNLDEPCPINHPALTEGKHYGCIKYITITAEQAKIIRALIEDNKLKNPNREESESRSSVTSAVSRILLPKMLRITL